MASVGFERYRVLLLGGTPLARTMAEVLLESGFRRFVIVDRSPVTEDDVDDVCFLPEDVAIRTHSECLARYISIDPEVRATASASDTRTLDGWNYPLVIGCSDNMVDRRRANRCARQYGIPYIDCTVHNDRGRIQVVFPYGPCLECSLGARPYSGVCRGSEGAMRRVAEAARGEVLKILTRHEDECISGVLYIDDSDGKDYVLSLGVSSQCPCHKEDSWQSR